MAKNCILVCCHKPLECKFGDGYFPIQCGAALHSCISGMQSDDFQGGISEKNGLYCELTGMYWAWKNLTDTDVIGLCHYRRFFDFHNQSRFPYQCFDPSQIAEKDLSIPKDLLKRVADGAIIAPSPTYLRSSVAMDFCYHHNSSDFRLLEDAANSVGELREDFKMAMHASEKLYSCNMFIMHRSEFEKMCSYMFSVLERVENRINLDGYDVYQRRIMGFLGERLMNVWFYHRRDMIVETPVMVFSDTDRYQGMSRMMYGIQHARILLGRKIMFKKI